MRASVRIGVGFVLVVCGVHGAVTSTSRLMHKEPDLAPMAHTQFCQHHPNNCQAKGGIQPVQLTGSRQRELTETNANINAAIAPVEQWNIEPAIGDCNDYDVTKQDRLMQKGWPSASLLLAEVILRDTGEHHLILVAKTSTGDFVLDNRTDEVAPMSEAKLSYLWRRVQSAENPRIWKAVEIEVRAYRRRQGQ
jgi:predicted transglutaminase-like cysteine proteinase